MPRALPALALLLLASLASGCDSRKAYSVRSTPPGAEVLLDGKAMGVTPTSLFLDTQQEEHVVVLRRPGWTTVERRVLTKPLIEGPTRNCTVVACSPCCLFVPLARCWERSFLPEAIDAVLERDGQGLEVICRPVGARVYVDGILVGQAEAVLEERIQNGVRVSCPSEEGVVLVPLEPKVVRLEIRADGYVSHDSQVQIRSKEYVRLRLNLLSKDAAPKP